MSFNQIILAEMLTANIVFLIISILIIGDEYPGIEWFSSSTAFILLPLYLVVNYFLWRWIKDNPIK